MKLQKNKETRNQNIIITENGLNVTSDIVKSPSNNVYQNVDTISVTDKKEGTKNESSDSKLKSKENIFEISEEKPDEEKNKDKEFKQVLTLKSGVDDAEPTPDNNGNQLELVDVVVKKSSEFLVVKYEKKIWFIFVK